MEGQRMLTGTTTLKAIMCLLVLSIAVHSTTAAQCGCCVSARAKACCFACIAAVVAKMKEMGANVAMEGEK
uniref:Uncharacterized protein n=1 Tax=Hordeum vulgare subsp. vulgare TaxID=112509 RepID=A0A8I6YKL7_HORVV